MTRRDRAAMVLALEWARVTPGRGGGPLLAREEACHALRMGHSLHLPSMIAFCVGEAASKMVNEMADHGDCSSGEARYLAALNRNRRLLRARLALLLRALLRADRGGYGPLRFVCTWRATHRTVEWVNHGTGACLDCDAPAVRRPGRITPLWEQCR